MMFNSYAQCFVLGICLALGYHGTSWIPFLNSATPSSLSSPPSGTTPHVPAPLSVPITFNLHRNGEYHPCNAATSITTSLSPHSSVYEFDRALTVAILASIPNTSCEPVDPNASDLNPSFAQHCDMGPLRTPLLHSSSSVLLLPPPHATLPCSYYTRIGDRITDLTTLTTHLQTGTSLYAVAAGRHFLFGPGYVGETFLLPRVGFPSGNRGKPVELITLSVSPRVFEVSHFFTGEEADDIVERALSTTSETHKMKPSSTGVDGYKVNPTRTSENAFDTHSATALKLKQRCFDTLAMEYKDNLADGLQILRYNRTTAYIPHLDWIDDSPSQPHDFESGGLGSNRFATILLYFTDPPDEESGGETVFTFGEPYQNDIEHPTYDSALSTLRADPVLSPLFKTDSWQEKMVAQCQSALHTKPHRAKAVLFYSQHPDGRKDIRSKHGGCPVLNDEEGKNPKWAANLWVWNAARFGYKEAPTKANYDPDNKRAKAARKSKLKDVFKSDSDKTDKLVTFVNNGNREDLDLYYEDTFWSKLPPGGKEERVNSFEGHAWNVREGAEVIQKWVVGKKNEQAFALA